MKRSAFKRRTRVKPVNRERKAKSKARNFGDEADAVRAMPCIVSGELGCEPAHDPSRGAGGGRFDMFPLRPDLHAEQHRIGIESFAAKYGIDPRAEADRVAISHASPLGIRGLAQRWAAWIPAADWCSACDTHGVSVKYEESGADICGSCGARNHCTQTVDCPLGAYEREALLGWVRRELSRDFERQRAKARKLATAYGPTSAAAMGAAHDVGDREALAHALMHKLGAPFTDDVHGEHGLAWTLCEAAGWPEVTP